MYRPKAFDITDLGEIHDLIDSIGVANVVTVTHGAPTASFVPLLLDRERGELGTLLGHLARPNEQWTTIDAGSGALAIFSGADAYVSPSYYPSKAQSGKVVPTWNYVAVHAHGPFVVRDDEAWLAALTRRLTERHEASRDVPWSVDDAPAEYIGSLLRAIVGFEIPIGHLEGKAKLSQNKSRTDIDGVVAGLAVGSADERAVAQLMQ
jgi:transcriptional regulator